MRLAQPLPRRCRYDVVVAGGGPAGATAALCLARRGVEVLLVERSPFPRFHIGESLLPRNRQLLAELGLLEHMAEVPHLRKVGAEFAFGDEEEGYRFEFSQGLLEDRETETFNVERAGFDRMLLGAAAEAGAEVVEGAAVGEILRLADDEVAVTVGERRIEARILVDASGTSTLVGNHLATKRPYPGHRKLASFAHFRGVERLAGDAAGHPTIVMLADGWFWLIGLDDERTSIGVVMDLPVARQVQRRHGLGARQLLAWAMPRCPLVARRTAAATAVGEPHAAADFSYRCRPYAGPGYFLVGDAATFLDPIFSSGVCLGMVGGREAARRVAAVLGGASPRHQQSAYRRFVAASSAPIFRLVRRYYQHPFRELLRNGEGPLQVHRALLSLLAGHVFPRPPRSLAWRQRLMGLLTEIQGLRPMAPQRPRCYLQGAEPAVTTTARERRTTGAADGGSPPPAGP